MRFYTNKFICQVADMAFDSLSFNPLESDTLACPLVDDGTLAAFKAEVLDTINRYEKDALLREDSGQLIQFCHDVKKYLLDDVESVPDVCFSCGAFSGIHGSFGDLIEFVEDGGSFTNDDRFRASQMIVDILCLGKSEVVLKQKFINYALCRVFCMYASEDSFLFSPDDSRMIAELLLKHNPEGVYGLIAILHMARRERVPFRQKQLLEDAFEIIRSIRKCESTYQQWFGISLVVLLFLDNENHDLLSAGQKEVVRCVMHDYMAIMSIDVHQSPQYSEHFLGIEPFSLEYFETYTDCVLYDKLSSEIAFYKSATSGAFSTRDLVRCVQFTYVYAVMISRGPAEAYDVKGFLECQPYDDQLFLECGNQLLNTIIQEHGETNYKLSPEHKNLAEKAQIGAKLDVINNQLGSMQDALNVILSKVGSVSEFGNRLEEVISNAFKAEVDRLESAIVDSESAPQIDIIENFISGQVGACWDRTSASARKAILAAAYYLEAMPDDEFFDARGITLCASVALEQELDAVFHRAWYSYLEDNYSDSSQLMYWPSRWREYDSSHEPVEHRPFEDTEFTLGTMPYLFGWSERDGKYCPVRNRYRGYSIPIEDFLMGHFDVDEPFDWFTAEGGILDEIDDVRIRFRNPAAHGDPISGEDARSCMKRILGISSDNDSIDTDALLWRILDVKK